MRADRVAVMIAAGFILAAVITTRRGSRMVPDNGDGEPVVSIPPEDEGIFPESVEEAATAVIDAVKDATAGVQAFVFGTKYDSLINASAIQAGIDPGILYRLLYRESRFREDIISGAVKSPAGALGIAQFMPATAVQWLGSAEAALDPNRAIPGAARYLKYLQTYFGGDMVKAVAAYNWGMGNVQNKGLANAPAETRQYVRAILNEGIA